MSPGKAAGGKKGVQRKERDGKECRTIEYN